MTRGARSGKDRHLADPKTEPQTSPDQTFYSTSVEKVLGESKVTIKPFVIGDYGARLSAVLLFFALIPLAAAIQMPQSNVFPSISLYIPPGVQNQYPVNATRGHRIVIVTTVTSAACALLCITDYNQVIVNVLLPNSSVILSTALANPAAANTVTAPATPGPWHLVVQVLWNDPVAGGTMAVYQTTITIKILGSVNL